jgi:hypothetical protein
MQFVRDERYEISPQNLPVNGAYLMDLIHHNLLNYR